MNNERLISAQQINEVDINKVNNIKESIKANGWTGRKILIQDLGNEYRALTGSHRLEALSELLKGTDCEYELATNLDCFEVITDLNDIYSYTTTYGYDFTDCQDDDDKLYFLQDMAANCELNDNIKTYLTYIQMEVENND
jgi:hypothetical protein